MGLLADLQSLPPVQRRRYAEDCLLVLDRAPLARVAYAYDDLVALEAIAERPEPLRYAEGDLDVKRMIHLMRRMPDIEAAGVARGLLLLLDERPHLRRDVDAGDLAYLEQHRSGPKRFSEVGPRAPEGALTIDFTKPSPVKLSREEGHALASFYAAAWNDYLDEGGTVTKAEREDAGDELAGEWQVEMDRDLRWRALPGQPVRYAASDWKPSIGPNGGKRWTNLAGEVVWSEQNPGISAAERQKARAKSEHAQPEKLHTLLQPHASDHKLTEAEKATVKRAFASLNQHHGKLTAHRLKELADDFAHAMAASKDPERKKAFGKRLAMLHQMVSELIGAEPEEKKKFSSTQFEFDADETKLIEDMTKEIPDEDLAEDGREDRPHVTCLYGLHSEDADQVRKIVEGFGPVKAKLGETSVFPASGDHDFDVVKIDVESEDLRRLNKLLSEKLPHTDKYDEYKPHVTLAYVKKGLGKKHAGKTKAKGLLLDLRTLIFSDLDKKKTKIPLEEKKRYALGGEPMKPPKPEGTLKPAKLATGTPSQGPTPKLPQPQPLATTIDHPKPAVDHQAATKMSVIPGKPSRPLGQADSSNWPSNPPRPEESKARAAHENDRVKHPFGPKLTEHDVAGFMAPPPEDRRWFHDNQKIKQLMDPDAAITDVKNDLHPGINGAMHVTLSNGAQAVFKTTLSEELGRSTSVRNNYGGREAASWQVSEILDGGHIRPPTVFRTIDGVPGSLSSFVPGMENAERLHARGQYAYGDSADDLAIAAALDIVTANVDMHMNNFGIADGKIVKFDNGFSFPDSNDEWLRITNRDLNGQGRHEYYDGGALVREAAKRSLPVPPAAANWMEKWPEIEAAMHRHGLRGHEVAMTKHRLQLIASAARNRLTVGELLVRMKRFLRDA